MVQNNQIKMERIGIKNLLNNNYNNNNNNNLLLNSMLDSFSNTLNIQSTSAIVLKTQNKFKFKEFNKNTFFY